MSGEVNILNRLIYKVECLTKIVTRGWEHNSPVTSTQKPRNTEASEEETEGL